MTRGFVVEGRQALTNTKSPARAQQPRQQAVRSRPWCAGWFACWLLAGVMCCSRSFNICALAVLGWCTIVWGAFALFYSVLIAAAGVIWTQGDVRVAHLVAPFLIGSACMIAAGILDVGPGSQKLCKTCMSQRCALITALILRVAPFGTGAYLVIYIAVWSQEEQRTYPPSPPVWPLCGDVGCYPPTSPMPPAYPPSPPWSPFNPGETTINGFFTAAAILSLVAVVITPIFEILLLCDKQGAGKVGV